MEKLPRRGIILMLEHMALFQSEYQLSEREGDPPA
jgi:hypothetical protein